MGESSTPPADRTAPTVWPACFPKATIHGWECRTALSRCDARGLDRGASRRKQARWRLVDRHPSCSMCKPTSVSPIRDGILFATTRCAASPTSGRSGNVLRNRHKRPRWQMRHGPVTDSTRVNGAARLLHSAPGHLVNEGAVVAQVVERRPDPGAGGKTLARSARGSSCHALPFRVPTAVHPTVLRSRSATWMTAPSFAQCGTFAGTRSRGRSGVYPNLGGWIPCWIRKACEKVTPCHVGSSNRGTSTTSGSSLSNVKRITPTLWRRRGGRTKFSDDLPRQRVVANPDSTDCTFCKKPMKQIGEESSEQIHYEPATMTVIETVRPKYACPTCKDGVRCAPPPKTAIPKSKATASTLAHVAVSKYVDHLPLVRQVSMFERQGLFLSKQTLCGWIRQISDMLNDRHSSHEWHRVLPVEVKSSQQPRLRDARGLGTFLREVADLASGGLLLHTGRRVTWITKQVLALP